ncbi:MAG: cytochrome b/b6 domain-containing protein [Paracoccus sp. (in: a-proteobacteria)]|nr:cytochrome b/b6 domain-containing protein [Paracoccus sp. (in: a-proteobacteria)]
MRRNSPTGYGSVARIFHWLTAGLILANIAIGLVATRIPLEQTALKFGTFSIHKTLGIAAFAVALARTGWAMTQTRPAPMHPERRVETALAETVHWLLYGAMVLVPLTGWIQHAASEGYARILWPFGQGLPLIPRSPELAGAMGALHHIFVLVLMGAIALHVAGALKHALIDRDGVLARMLTGYQAGGRVTRRHVFPVLLALAILGTGAGWALTSAPRDPGLAPRLEQVASDWQVVDGDLTFDIRQMGTTVTGGFSDWTAQIDYDRESGTGVVRVVINMDSVTIGTVTQQAKGADFFDVPSYPEAVFTAQIARQSDDGNHIADGTLTLRGQTAPLALPFTLDITDGLARMEGALVMDRRVWNIGAGYDDDSTVGFEVALRVNLTARR